MPVLTVRGIAEIKADLQKEAAELPRRIVEAATTGLYEAVLKYYWGRGSSGGFWWRIAKAFKRDWAHPESGVARVFIDGQEAGILRHKIDGGEIRAKNAQALAIPLTQQAKKYASPLDVPNPLVLIKTRMGNCLLAEVEKRHGSKGGRVKPWYVLKQSVWQGPDPAAVPPDDFIMREVKDRISYELEGRTF